ncbi:hypothetical protein E4U52_006663 [Claviceps spartinae]|nr:hypothetical protein E4U52_006663 [Claviceps spartinae]
MFISVRQERDLSSRSAIKEAALHQTFLRGWLLYQIKTRAEQSTTLRFQIVYLAPGTACRSREFQPLVSSGDVVEGFVEGDNQRKRLPISTYCEGLMGALVVELPAHWSRGGVSKMKTSSANARLDCGTARIEAERVVKDKGQSVPRGYRPQRIDNEDLMDSGGLSTFKAPEVRSLY